MTAAPPLPVAPNSIPPPRTSWRRVFLAALISIVVALCFAWLLYKGALPVLPPPSAFAGVRWWVVPAYGLIFLVCLLLRSVRWRWLLRPIQPVGLKRILTISFIFFGASVLLPFRTGELVRPSLFRKKEHMSWWAATGIVGAERIIDGLILSLLLFVALRLAQPLPKLPSRIGNLPVPVTIVPSAAYSALAMFVAAFIGMGLFYWRREWMRRVIRRIIGVFSIKLAELVAGALERFADGLSFLPTVRYSAPFVLITAAYWIINAIGIWMVIWGVGLDTVTPAQGAAVLGVLALGFLTPTVPGFFGTFQLSVYAGLAMYFPPEKVVTEGAVAVFLLYVTQIAVVLVSSTIAFIVESFSPATPRTATHVTASLPTEGA